jgi:hypothetical protein
MAAYFHPNLCPGKLWRGRLGSALVPRQAKSISHLIDKVGYPSIGACPDLATALALSYAVSFAVSRELWTWPTLDLRCFCLLDADFMDAVLGVVDGGSERL